MKTLGLLSISDIDNFAATKQSVSSFQKYHGNDIVIVSTQHTQEIDALGHDLNVPVYKGNTKFNYPAFTVNELDLLYEWIVECIFKPVSYLKSEYFVVGEPDCLFFKETNMNDIDHSADIMTPHPYDNNEHLFWVFTHFLYGYGNNDEERYTRISKLFEKFGPICEKYRLNWKQAADSDLRFVFTCGSILKTKRINELYNNHRDDIKGLLHDICKEIYDNKPIPEINPRCTSLFSVDLMLSIILGLYLFKWKIKPNYRNCSQQNFPDEDALQEFLSRNPDTEFIHSIKLYYKNRNELVCEKNTAKKLKILV